MEIKDVHEHWIDTKSREIWIHGIDILASTDYEGGEPGVEYMMATRVIKNLHILLKQSRTKPVTLHLHSCGGIWEEGMAIYDTIKAMPYKTTIITYTHARSMSSIILQAADKRLMLPNSSFMFHYGGLWVGGEAKTVYSNVDFTKHTDEIMLDIYLQAIRKSKSKKFKSYTDEKLKTYLRSMMDKKGDVYLTAKEAVEWGFADGILEKF